MPMLSRPMAISATELGFASSSSKPGRRMQLVAAGWTSSLQSACCLVFALDAGIDSPRNLFVDVPGSRNGPCDVSFRVWSNHDRRDLVSEQQSSRADRLAPDATCANLCAYPEYTCAKKGCNHGERIVFAVPAVEAPIISYLTRGGQETLDAFAPMLNRPTAIRSGDSARCG